jgi:hypothetical protein
MKAPVRYGDDPKYARLAITEPRNYKEAMNSHETHHWKKAIEAERDVLIANQTWSLVDLPKNRKPIGCRWVFKIKYDAKGEIEHYKARLVAKGYAQIHNVDYTEMFAPVVKFNSIRTLLALAAHHDLDVHQMDVKAAYLNGDLEEEIYMSQPEGIVERKNEQKVCRLNKSIYGLKQAGRSWYQKIDTYLESIGLTRTSADNCVYFKRSNDGIIIVTVYVDDLLIFANKMSEIDELKKRLNEKFEMADLGEAHYILGIQIKRNRDEGWIRINQKRYIDDVLERFGMADCKPMSAPMDPNVKLSKGMSPKTRSEEENMKTVPYQNAVGSLMYVMTGTRPDIAYAVGAVSAYNANPGEAHWKAVKRIIRYLKGSRDLELTYSHGTKTIEGYADADWAGSLDDRRSTTGYVFILHGGAITWNSKKQPTVALSTTEAEYLALGQAAKESIWLKKLLTELGFHQKDRPIEINSDNQGAIALTKNPTFHARTKHIDIRHHFLREKYEAKEIAIAYCGTNTMVADILTKALAKDKHEGFVSGMGLRNV